MNKTRWICSLLVILILVLCGGCIAEGIQPYASSLITSYSISTDRYTGGKIMITTDIVAFHSIEKLGFSSVKIQEYDNDTWTTVKRATNKYAYNALSHGYSLSYDGTTGMKYRGVVSFYAKDGATTSGRTVTGSEVTAK